MNKETTVRGIIEDVIIDICEDYCKWPELYEDEDALLDEKCDDCPLNRL